jgi:hypothetical protein
VPGARLEQTENWSSVRGLSVLSDGGGRANFAWSLGSIPSTGPLLF